MKNLFVLCFLLSLCMHQSMASMFYHGQYRIGLFKDSYLDNDKPTHVIIVGSAVKDDSNQFFQSGVARAQRYKELWPNDQVVIMSSPEVKGTDDEAVFDEFNIVVVQLIKENFTGDKLIKELMAFNRIESLDFYGHSSPWSLILGKRDSSFDPTAYPKSLKILKNKFSPNAFITLNGCNTGFTIAPALSRLLELPVSGSLTSSLFERIESDGLWYKEYDWSSGNYVEINNRSYNESLSCSLGFCWRMKPSRFSYSSYWGVFKEGGLSFYKFFCNFDNNRDKHCEKGMAKSLLAFPSVHPLTLNSSIDEFKDVAFDWLCSTANDKKYFNKCIEGISAAIKRGDFVFQTHPGNELMCDFKSCKAKVICKDKIFGQGPRGGSCKIEAEQNPNPTTAARELESLLTGFHGLKDWFFLESLNENM